MAYNSNDLSVLAYANNFTLWHYTTTDSSITTGGFFDPAADMMQVGDFLIANVDTDGVPVNQFYVVTANTGSNVSITAYS